MTKEQWRNLGIIFTFLTIFSCFWSYTGIGSSGSLEMEISGFVGIIFCSPTAIICLLVWRRLAEKERRMGSGGNFGVQMVPADKWRRLSGRESPPDEPRPHIVPLNEAARRFLPSVVSLLSYKYLLGETLVRSRWRPAVRFLASEDLDHLKEEVLPRIEAAFAEYKASR